MLSARHGLCTEACQWLLVYHSLCIDMLVGGIEGGREGSAVSR